MASGNQVSDDTKRKFREALERKNSSGTDHKGENSGHGKVEAPTAPRPPARSRCSGARPVRSSFSERRHPVPGGAFRHVLAFPGLVRCSCGASSGARFRPASLRPGSFVAPRRVLA